MKQKYVFDIYIILENISNGYKYLMPAGYDVLEFDHFPNHREILEAYKNSLFLPTGNVIKTIGFCSAIAIDDGTYRKFMTINNVRLLPEENTTKKKTIGKIKNK